jgi:uncharacterized membrane protein (DUF2068 family)
MASAKVISLAMCGEETKFAPRQKSRPHRWLSAFFMFGAIMCALTIALLLFPGTALDLLWRLNPNAHTAFQSIGNWSIAIMFVVGSGCLFTAIGLWRGTIWGTWIAVIILIANMAGDLFNAFFRRDYRALLGLTGAAAMIFYLVRPDCNRE